jgi:hypothetical protein
MRPRLLIVLMSLVIVWTTPKTTRGFAVFGSIWGPGDIVINLQLDRGGHLTDGSDDFNAAAEAALTTWNAYMDRSRFVADSGTDGHADGDFVNQVFFDSDFYGESFGRDTVAITTRWTFGGSERVEADVVFNNAFNWDSYRGKARAGDRWDIRRVALHEFGHALGLDHPDEHGQRVNAIMNSIVGDLELPTADDIAGVRALYGAGAPATSVLPRLGPLAPFPKP